MKLMRGLGYVFAALWLSSGCSFSESAGKSCNTPADCDGNECYLGRCVAPETSGETGGKGGRTGTSNAETPGTEGGSGGRTGSTASPSMTNPGTSGAGGRSMSTPSTGGQGGRGGAGAPTGTGGAGMMSLPPPAMGDCKASDAPRSCVYSTGCMGTQRCAGTTWGACEPPAERLTMPETCDGVDNNCNGMVDEPGFRACVRAGTAGCTEDAAGKITCLGVCEAGSQQCVDGKWGECTGGTAPQPMEMCQGGGGTALDENCDGTADEGCNCTADMSCYNGRGMPGIGECRSGFLKCNDGRLDTQCVGEVRDSLEICNAKDDDCNGMTDDVLTVGFACQVPGARGRCVTGKLRCVTGSAIPQCVADNMATTESCNGDDDDCNGMTDDVPGLDTNVMMCGGCGRPACTAPNNACCASGCVNTQTDTRNCGMCGKTCAATETCTAGMCRAMPMGGAGSPAGGAGSPAGGAGASGSPSGGAGASGSAGGAAGTGSGASD